MEKSKSGKLAILRRYTLRKIFQPFFGPSLVPKNISFWTLVNSIFKLHQTIDKYVCKNILKEICHLLPVGVGLGLVEVCLVSRQPPWPTFFSWSKHEFFTQILKNIKNGKVSPALGPRWEWGWPWFLEGCGTKFLPPRGCVLCMPVREELNIKSNLESRSLHLVALCVARWLKKQAGHDIALNIAANNCTDHHCRPSLSRLSSRVHLCKQPPNRIELLLKNEKFSKAIRFQAANRFPVQKWNVSTLCGLDWNVFCSFLTICFWKWTVGYPAFFIICGISVFPFHYFVFL